MKVAFVANHTVDVGKIAMHILDQIFALPTDATVLLRQPREGDAGEFERTTARLCKTMEIAVEWRASEEGGRAAVMERNILMAREADLVIAYFDPTTEMGGGTGHLLDKAIEHEQAVIHAFSCGDDGIHLIGSWEPALDA